MYDRLFVWEGGGGLGREEEGEVDASFLILREWWVGWES
jgi:hypothetical protein